MGKSLCQQEEKSHFRSRSILNGHEYDQWEMKSFITTHVLIRILQSKPSESSLVF